MKFIEPKIGVLIVNLGTPASPRTRDVRRYLREFLSDPRVLSMPAPLRWILLHAIILPTRPRKSAAAYEKIWQPDGSPLLIHGRALAEGVAHELGETYRVELAMRYGAPSIPEAVDRLAIAGVDRMIVLPLFPQYSAAATASALARVHACVSDRWDVRPITTIGAFYDDAGFIDAVVRQSSSRIDAFQPDHILFSYHGLPEQQIRRSDPTGEHCLATADCCSAPESAPRHCYRAQCFATTRALASKLELRDGTYTTTFQSRLGRKPWIVPHTDRFITDLAEQGVRRLAVLCPAFVADCLETIEEIGIRLRDQWHALGGEDLLLCPCPNAEPGWVKSVADLIARHAACGGRSPERGVSAD